MHTRYTLLLWYNGINATHSLSFRKPQNCPIHDCSFLPWRLDLIQRLYRNRSETQISSGHCIEETLQVLPVDSAPPTGPSHLAMWRQTWCSTRLRPTLPLLRLIHCKWVVISRHNNDLKIEDTSSEAECWSLKKRHLSFLLELILRLNWFTYLKPHLTKINWILSITHEINYFLCESLVLFSRIGDFLFPNFCCTTVQPNNRTFFWR